MHSFSEGSVGDQICRYPMVLGHEPSGVVLKTGAGVTGWQAGDEAALEPAIYCYHCEYCLSGHHNVCANIRFLSSVDDPGFFRERVNLPAINLLPLEPGVGLKEASLIEPLAICLHSLELAPVHLGHQVVVIGGGPIGLLTVACLRLSGAKRIFVVEPLSHRRALAVEMGADEAFDPASGDVAAEVRKRTASGAHTIYDCAAKSGTVDLAAAMARNRGSIVLTGIHSEVAPAWNVHTMRRKELTLYHVRRSNHESVLARRLLAEHGTRFAPVITHSRRLSQIQQAFEMNERYADGVGKLLVLPTF